MNKVWKAVRVLLFVVFLTIIAGALFTLLYEKEITNLFVKEINKHLVAEIKVEKIKFSMLKKFPNAALELKDITVFTPTEKNKKSVFNNDTVLNAESLFLQFDLTDLIKKDYLVKRINVKNGNLNLEISGKNKKNFIIWKTKSDTISSKVKLKLRGVRFTNIRTTYNNKNNSFDFQFFLNKLNIKGDLLQERGQFTISSDFFIKEFLIKEKSYLQNTNPASSFTIHMDNGNYNILDGEINFPGLNFTTSGTIFTNPEKEMELNITGKNLDVKRLVRLLPEKISNELNNYNYKGNLSLNAALSGNYGQGRKPHIESFFTITNAEVKKRDIDYFLIVKNASGSFTNGTSNNRSTSILEFDSYRVNIAGSTLTGKAVLSSFPEPFINFNTSGEIDLAKLIRFFNIKKIEKGSGIILANINLSGKLSKTGNHKPGFIKDPEPTGYIKLNDVTFKTKGSLLEFNNIYGTLKFSRNLMLDAIKMNIGGNKININGKIGNALSKISGKEMPLIIEANVSANQFNPSVFIEGLRKKDMTDSISKPYFFPDSLFLDLTLDFGSLNYKKFSASNFHGILLYKPGMLNLNSVTFKSMKGSFSGSSVVFQNINGNFLSRTQSDLENINIKELFYSFNNFGQKFITDQHVNGKLTGDINFTSHWTNNVQIIKKNLIAESSVKITDGELIAFEPMLGLAHYIKVSELKHIHFSELVNRIIIRDEKITIPQMDINSSAFNISLSGTHNFDNNFSYKTKVLLSEVLAGKAKRGQRVNEDFGEIKDDGLGKTSLYLSIEGNPKDYKVSYDRETALQKVKKDLQNEKKEIKSILHDEFGLFRQDTLTYPSDNNSNKNIFNIIWDEEKTDSSKTDTISDSSFKILWEEDDTAEIDEL